MGREKVSGLRGRVGGVERELWLLRALFFSNSALCLKAPGPPLVLYIHVKAAALLCPLPHPSGPSSLYPGAWS